MSFGINTKDWYFGRFPMAVDTALLGEVHPKTRKKAFIDINQVLAVVPTWIALRDHVPVVIPKDCDTNKEAEVRGDDTAAEKGSEKGPRIAIAIGEQ